MDSLYEVERVVKESAFPTMTGGVELMEVLFQNARIPAGQLGGRLS